MDIIHVEQELRVDSRQLASHLDTRHRTILESIDKYIHHFKDISEVPFKTEPQKEARKQGGKSLIRYALLSEDQCYFLLTLMRNNEKVVALKLNLVKAFRDARKKLAERDIARINGKEVRRAETDAIKALVEYAKAAGSSSPEMYYMTITKMTNKALGIEPAQRDAMDHRQLQLLRIAETMVDIAIRDGIKASMHYKDVYALCRDRVQEIVGQLRIS